MIGTDSPPPIRVVELRFENPPSWLDASYAASEWTAFGLSARMEGAVLRLSRWSWGSDDLAQLTWMLKEIGRTQHARHGIRSIVVHRGCAPVASN